MLSTDQVDFLLALLANTQIGGGLIDIAYQTKQALIAARVALTENKN